MVENFDVDITNFDTILSGLTISKPRKTDDSLFGKITFEDKGVNIHFNNLEVIRHKRIQHLNKFYSVLVLKVPKSMCKTFVDFDNHCINQVKKNIASWFSKALDENIIEEYYTSSVIVSKNDGFLIKLKLYGIEDLLDTKQRYDMMVTLKGLRFYKQRFIPEWDMHFLKEIDTDFLNSLQVDDENEDIWIDNDENDLFVPEPDIEEIKTMYNTLYEKIETKYKQVSKKNEKYQRLHLEIISLLDKLKSNSMNLQVLENVNDEYEKKFA
jgi:hypothetical protein